MSCSSTTVTGNMTYRVVEFGARLLTNLGGFLLGAGAAVRKNVLCLGCGPVHVAWIAPICVSQSIYTGKPGFFWGGGGKIKEN